MNTIFTNLDFTSAYAYVDSMVSKGILSYSTTISHFYGNNTYDGYYPRSASTAISALAWSNMTRRHTSSEYGIGNMSIQGSTTGYYTITFLYDSYIVLATANASVSSMAGMIEEGNIFNVYSVSAGETLTLPHKYSLESTWLSSYTKENNRMNVFFKEVVAQGGSTAAERFAAMTKDSHTFYLVGTDIYLADQKLNNAAAIADAVASIATNTADIATINTTLTKLEADENTNGSIRYIIKSYLDALDATDIPIVDSDEHFTATDVEGALAELAVASAGGVASKTVYLQDASSGQATYAKVYRLYQGEDSADMTNNTLVGTINVPKDLVVQSGHIVTVTSGVDSDGDSTTVADGTYIKLIIQNQTDPIYINVADLVDAYTGGTTTEATVSISANNEITVTIVEISGSKLTDGTVTKAKLSTAVQGSLDNADSAVQSVVEGSTNGTIAVDGVDVNVHGLGSAAYTASTAYDVAGAADAVLGDSTTDTAATHTVEGLVKKTDAINTAIGNLATIATTGAAADASVADADANFSSQTKNVETILAEIATHLTWEEV